jgi:PAS domain S-box-containing protein
MPVENDRPASEHFQILARIAELEEEARRLRRVVGGIDKGEGGDMILENTLQYKEVFDNISVCMFVVDVTPEDRFRFVGLNRAEEEAIGLTNTQVAGRFVEDIFRAEVANQIVASYRRAVEAGKPIHFESDVDLPAGKRSFHTNLIPLRDVFGRIYRIAGACIDVTDFRKAQREALTRQRMESLGLLAGGVAHDFGNLLSSILMESEVALTNVAQDSPVRHTIDAIRTLALQAGEIVRVLMAYAGQENPLFEPIDLSNTVTQTLAALKPSLSRRALLQTDLPNDLPVVMANPGQIRQVVMNLLANASEALGDEEGTITLRVAKVLRGTEGPESADPEQPVATFIRLEVSDSGCGMTEEVQTRIFDPFYTTKSGGRGLGLASVLGIVNAHGGRIQVTSSRGNGSRFEVLLPTVGSPRSAVTDSALPKPLAKVIKSPTVLLIEDEMALRRALSKLLRAKGFCVTEAVDGPSALDVFRANPAIVEIVLLDMTLPKMSGQAVFQELRRIRPDVKVILTTGHSKERALRDIGGERNWRFIRKPYEIAALYDLMQGLLANGTNEKHG